MTSPCYYIKKLQTLTVVTTNFIECVAMGNILFNLLTS